MRKFKKRGGVGENSKSYYMMSSIAVYFEDAVVKQIVIEK
jgi:hypothetical protein